MWFGSLGRVRSIFSLKSHKDGIHVLPVVISSSVEGPLLGSRDVPGFSPFAIGQRTLLFGRYS